MTGSGWTSWLIRPARQNTLAGTGGLGHRSFWNNSVAALEVRAGSGNSEPHRLGQQPAANQVLDPLALSRSLAVVNREGCST
jgi:hypothetical protein